MAEMYLQLFRQLKPNTQLQRSLRSFKLESNKVESGSKPTDWIAEWHDYYHHLTAIGYYQGIGCNQAFMEAAHLIFTAEMIEMNYYNPSVTAAFIEAWCGYIAEHEPKLLEENRRGCTPTNVPLWEIPLYKPYNPICPYIVGVYGLLSPRIPI